MRKPLIVLALLGLVATASAGASSYTVRRGDTLGTIAARTKTSVPLLVRINHLTNPDRITVGQVLSLTEPRANPASAKPATYTVRKGDSLAVIAKRFGTTVRALMDLNGIKHQDRITIGQVLKLAAPPAPASSTKAVAPKASPAMKPISSVHVVVPGVLPTYVVRKGDNAKSIAKRNKVTVAALGKANPGVNLNVLPVGIPIKLPVAPVWTCPVAGPNRFDDTWGAFRADTGAHVGTDMLAKRGTPVVAPVGGTLELRPGGKIGGNAFYVHGDDGNTYYGAHLDGYVVGAGRIEQGQQIGIVGDTGDAKGTPTHLHFEIHPGGGGPVDPFFTLEAWC